MPNKEPSRAQITDGKTAVPAPNAVVKITGNVTKTVNVKVNPKETAMSPGQLAQAERTELLGSLTTQQQQRTSARVIKKLRLEPPVDKKKSSDVCDEIPECDTPSKIDEKELKFPTVKQRMPKALWSTDEKDVFFEALNEYGKDFDAITAHICAKMKKKGMADLNLKTKTQVSHFYYRTWHKLSKHVHFDENVKKVAQELYALINYGELRKKLVSVSEKTCARLGEMVSGGSMLVRARGRNLRVRTPMCRALRRLNQITERACGSRVCSRAEVRLRARDAAAWARVQAAAHNPRLAVELPLRTRLTALLCALTKRWTPTLKHIKNSEIVDKVMEDIQKDTEINQEKQNRGEEDKDDDGEDLGLHLNLETDRMIVQEQKSKKLFLHLGPRPGAQIHLPVVRPSEQLSSQKICFSSYLERMYQKDKDAAKIRNPKRRRKDSATEKEKELFSKKIKSDESENRLMHIDETAIDGIELMAHYKNHQEEPSTEDEKDMKSEETAEEEIDRDNNMSEKEKDSFSEMEDDEKYNNDTDNDSDQGKSRPRGERRFKNLKVKFRIRPKKRGGSVYTLVLDNEDELKSEDNRDELKTDDILKEEPKTEEQTEEEAKIEEQKEGELKTEEQCEAEMKTEEKKEGDMKTEEQREVDEQKERELKAEEQRSSFDEETALNQVRRGWSEMDAANLTIGDLYLMFGSRSKLELDYWFAEPTPPLPQPQNKLEIERDRTIDEGERARESDDMLSPRNAFSQDSNDGLSGDEKKCELVSPERRPPPALGVAGKLLNRPAPLAHASQLSDRLKRLLALVGNPLVGAAPRCGCGHVCAHRKLLSKTQVLGQQGPVGQRPEENTVFRHPTPIAPRPATDQGEASVEARLGGVPRWRRGRPRGAERSVVVQRLLPLLPALPPPSNLIPVKIVPSSSPVLPKILPKPPPTTTADLSHYYILSESNGQFYFHDGDRRIPISPLQHVDSEIDAADNVNPGVMVNGSCDAELQINTDSYSTEKREARLEGADKCSGASGTDTTDLEPFLPSESLSLSLSPSRLLRDGPWLDAAHDFSLSSFLGHLDARTQPPVESQLQSLMAESSVDYVAKFADLAAEVTDPATPSP